MHSLFLKIFLWFWITLILTGIALVLTFVLQPGGVPARWHVALSETARVYGRAAVGEMERDGTSAAVAYLDDLHRSARTDACLFDQQGAEIAGHGCDSFQSLVKRAATSPTAAFGMRYGMVRVGLQVQGKFGAIYIFATDLPAGPRAAFGASGSGLALHWGVAFLVSGLICYLLTGYLTRPILRLREASRQLAQGNLTARAPGAEKRRDELGDLVRDFNSMGDRIETLVSSQRQLISDVSHELRSPLARLAVALDLARERKGDDPAFGRMEKDFERLNEMLSHLLTVARLDATTPSVEMSIVNWSVLVADVVEDAQFEARDRDRTVQLASGKDIQVRGNASLLRSAVENIIRNAVRYTAPGTTVEVDLRREESNNGSAAAVLTVRDHGPGVSDSEVSKIFRPFYRVGGARDRVSGGIGLGLAIADRVTRLHGGTLKAANAIGGGLEVQARIPSQKTPA